MLRRLLLVLLCGCPLMLFADTLEFPESPRILALSGAMAGLANDALSVLHNPAGVGAQGLLGYEMMFSKMTHLGTDRFALASVNPQSDRRGRFGAGVWTQGHLKASECGFVVPFATTAWSVASVHTGTTLRFPAHLDRAACAGVPRLAIVDMGLLFAPNSYRAGAMIERLIGGGAGVVPRRLKMGAAVVPDPRYTFSYEWRSESVEKDFDFRYASSHIGSEVVVGDYLALRGGYRWANQHRVSFGAAAGTIPGGWRMEVGWDVPTTRRGDTIWSLGLGFYAGGRSKKW